MPKTKVEFGFFEKIGFDYLCIDLLLRRGIFSCVVNCIQSLTAAKKRKSNTVISNRNHLKY